jgi:hypothetical protein
VTYTFVWEGKFEKKIGYIDHTSTGSFLQLFGPLLQGNLDVTHHPVDDSNLPVLSGKPTWNTEFSVILVIEDRSAYAEGQARFWGVFKYFKIQQTRFGIGPVSTFLKIMCYTLHTVLYYTLHTVQIHFKIQQTRFWIGMVVFKTLNFQWSLSLKTVVHMQRDKRDSEGFLNILKFNKLDLE